MLARTDGRMFCRCHNEVEACSPNSCPGGFDCKVSDGSLHCDPLPQVSHPRRRPQPRPPQRRPKVLIHPPSFQVSPLIGYMEMMEISASVLGLLLLVALFVCIRKRYVRQKKKKKKKPVCVQDSNG